MKRYCALFGIIFLAALNMGLAGCLLFKPPPEPQKWFEGTWNHEDGDLQLAISRSEWTLKWHRHQDFDEKGKISFNEEEQTFVMVSTHYWDSALKSWEKNDHRASGSYTASGKRWTITGCTLDDYDGVWTKQ